MGHWSDCWFSRENFSPRNLKTTFLVESQSEAGYGVGELHSVKPNSGLYDGLCGVHTVELSLINIAMSISKIASSIRMVRESLIETLADNL